MKGVRRRVNGAKRYLVVGAEQIAGALHLVDLGQYPVNALKDVAATCYNEGFHIMFEFDEKPDLAELVERVENGEGISSMPSMKRLWVLQAGEGGKPL